MRINRFINLKNIPLKVNRPKVEFGTTRFAAELSDVPAVFVGLLEKGFFCFPRGFQKDFDPVAHPGATALFRKPLEGEGMSCNGEPVLHIDILGFSAQAENGVLLDDVELDGELRQYFARALSQFFPSRHEAGSIAGQKIEALLQPTFNILEKLGLDFCHDWTKQMPEHPFNYFPFSIAVQIGANLFNAAFCVFRMKQLITLMEKAYRGNTAEKIRWLNVLVRRNMQKRLKIYPLSLEFNDIKKIESLDLALRIALIQEYARKERGEDLAISEEEAMTLSLFMYGDVYRRTAAFFEDLGEEVFQKLINYFGFWHEINSIVFILKKEGLWPMEDPLSDRMFYSQRHLAYQGAQVMDVFEQVSGQEIDPLSLPIPFDYYSVIDAHYADKN